MLMRRFKCILTAVMVFLVITLGNFVAAELIISCFLIMREQKPEDGVFCSKQRLDRGSLVHLATSAPERGIVNRVKFYSAVFPDACNTCVCAHAPAWELGHLHLS